MNGAKESILSKTQIAENCSASWDWMSGDDKVRYCHKCKLNVYNLSAMNEQEAEGLLRRNSDSGICGRFYRRLDGKIMTADCPLTTKVVDGTQRILRCMFSIATAIVMCIGAVVLGKTVLTDLRKQLQTSISQSFSQVCGNMQGRLTVPPQKPAEDRQ